VSRGSLRELVVRAVSKLGSAGKGKGPAFVAAFSCLAHSHSGLRPDRSHISDISLSSSTSINAP
jgi:hypothetical protein